MERGVSYPNRSKSFLWRPPLDTPPSLPASGPRLMLGPAFRDSSRNSSVDSLRNKTRLSPHDCRTRMPRDSDSGCRPLLRQVLSLLLERLFSAGQVRAVDTLAATGFRPPTLL